MTKVEIFGFEEKNRWYRIHCHSCGKQMGHRNFPEDDTILCTECFAEWDGNKGSGEYEISLDIKKK